jgi:ferredoxin-NADP reductase
MMSGTAFGPCRDTHSLKAVSLGFCGFRAPAASKQVMVRNTEARLVAWRDISPEVRHFLFEVPQVSSFEFAPGQFVSLSGGLDGKRISRAYSIASPPGGNRFELSLNRVKEGVFSPRLFELDPGDTIRIRGPYGVFILPTPASDSVFVATGTGIAPFRSMLRSRLPEDADHRFTLLFGCRHEAGLLYRDEFGQLERDHSNFRFLPAISRPGEGWPGRRGRVQQHLEEALAGRRDVDVYICGLNEMMNDVRERLAGMGFGRKQIHFERYD